MGAASKALLRLLDEHGAQRLEAALCEALLRETPEPNSVRLILERRRLEEGLAPRMPVALPDDPRVRDLAVRPATLEQYGSLGRGDDRGDAEAPTEEDAQANSGEDASAEEDDDVHS